MSLVTALTAALDNPARGWTVTALVRHEHEETAWAGDPATPSTVEVVASSYQLRDAGGLILTLLMTVRDGALDEITVMHNGVAHDVTAAAVRARLEALADAAAATHLATLVTALA